MVNNTNNKKFVKNIIKKDIINYLNHKIGLPKKELTFLVDDMFSIMSYVIVNKKKLLINSFGNFGVAHKNERTVFNPKTKMPNKISARKVVTFQASRKFRKYLINNDQN